MIRLRVRNTSIFLVANANLIQYDYVIRAYLVKFFAASYLPGQQSLASNSLAEFANSTPTYLITDHSYADNRSTFIKGQLICTPHVISYGCENGG
jgi:hypothetical protein